MSDLTSASLFTGGDLAGVGVLQAGHSLLWGIELDPSIAAVANANMPYRDKCYAASVVGFDWTSVERPDHLHLSPPCQDFSNAKTGSARNDNDGLADACIDAVTALSPSIVTLENVARYKKASAFLRIVVSLQSQGYWVDYSVLDAADFGVPQNRMRLIMRAVKGAIPSSLPPATQHMGWYDSVKDIADQFPLSKLGSWQLERLENLDIDDKKPFMVHSTNVRAMTVREAHEPSFTITAGSARKRKGGGPPTVTPRAVINGVVVRLNAKGVGRLQTLPDWYSGATTQIIGNGVPCLMMQRVMESIAG